jgi:exopolyphosphatase / guanosine-5'-triphosphate,3'-diphosphate pyrophosphatase
MATDPTQEGRTRTRDANAAHPQREGTATKTDEQAHRLVRRLKGALGATSDAPIRIRRMRVAVVDVGANTLRLLVAEADARGGFVPIREERRRTRLGEDVERWGRLTRERIERSAEVARKEVRRARKLGAARIEIVVTSPWRSAENGRELVIALEKATGQRVQPLGEEEEAELAYVGALSRTEVDSEPVAVCDVGGGSTQIAVGTRSAPSWLKSVPLGSLRLTERCLASDPPTRSELATARTEAAAAFGVLTPPLPAVALATGGTARALRRHGLSRLDEDGVARAIEELSRLSAIARAERGKVDLERARTLPAGAIIFAELQHLLQVPLGVADGGVREGVCSRLLEAEAATA